jgi:putative Mg2+ transporter-C (MgtC) family protein
MQSVLESLGANPHSTLSLGEASLRLLVASLGGALLGYDREKAKRAAGLRTHILVTLGAALFTLLGLELLGGVTTDFQHARIDPTRVLQGVVGGSGFLGAGVILRRDDRIEGVTTAATIWISGAIGAGCGLGKYILIGTALAIAFVGLALLRHVDDWIDRRAD